MREYGVIKIPTSLVSHIICLFAAVALVAIASIYFTPVITPFGNLVDLQLSQEWYSSISAIVVNVCLMTILTAAISTIANKYSLTILLSLFPTLFFLLLQCCNPNILLSFNIGILGAISFLVSTYYLFENYGKKRVEKTVYGITLILCASAILWDKIIFFIPLFWIGLAQLNMLTFKSGAASILAIATSTFILWATSYLGWGNFNFADFGEGLKSVIMLNDYKYIDNNIIYDIVYVMAILIVIMVYNLTNIYADSHEKISIKRYILFLNSALITTTLLMVINPLSIATYMPIFNSVSALLVAHYFNSIKSKAKLRFLYAIILTYITIYIVWIL